MLVDIVLDLEVAVNFLFFCYYKYVLRINRYALKNGKNRFVKKI